MDNCFHITAVRVRDNGLYDGAWRYTVELAASPWRLHLAPDLGETLWLHEPGDSSEDEPRTALASLPDPARKLAETALAAGPPVSRR